LYIAHVINSLQLGGAETLLAGITKEQINQGHSVKVICIQNVVEIQLDPSVELIVLNHRKFDIRTIKVLPGHLNDVDVVHAHLAPAHYFAAVVAMDKLFITEHASHNNRWDTWLFRYLDRILYNRVNAVIAISYPVRDILINTIRVKSNKIVTVPNGIDVADILNKKTFSVPEFLPGNASSFKYRIGMVSRFSPQKDFESVVHLAKHLPEALFILVGDGETRPKIENLVRAENLRNVCFTGKVRNPYPIMSTFDLGLQISRSEGFGLAALEMMALGKPVIMSDVPGLNELNVLQPTMDFFNSPGQAADYIRKIFSNPIWYDELVIRARCIATQFSLASTSQDYINLYQSCSQINLG
jgi:glycosyltransferase involved in cell wall biosynthesis